MIPLYNTDGQSQCPLGMAMCQNRLAVPMWSYAMEVHPPVRIIELGTYGGGFITAIAVHAFHLGARVITYDRMLPDERYTPLARFLRVEFMQKDLELASTRDEIVDLIRSAGRVYLLCDAGDKPGDFNRYAEHMKPGDVIAAHDYFIEGRQDLWCCQEIDKPQVAAAVARHDLEPFMQEHFDLAAWLVYRKRGA